MNNKGFAITTILYGILILFLMLLLSMLGILSTYKDRLEILIENSNGARDIVNGEYVEKEIGTSYAVYSLDDYSLRFYNTTDEITTGSKYNGLTATAVYTGFEDATYSSGSLPPWHSYRLGIDVIIFEDILSPTNTTYWFYGLNYVRSIDVARLDVSEVVNMNAMFQSVGVNGTSDGTLTIEGMEHWDVSNVQSMAGMFNMAGYNSGITKFTISDITGWNTSNVVNMSGMFANTAAYADWSLDLSGWETSNVTTCSGFNNRVTTQVTAPVFANC